MATEISLRHPVTGLTKKGYIGFSWTTLCWGCMPALFRGDFLTFLGAFAVLVVIAIITSGIGPTFAMIVWAFFYNRYYTRRLIERGYQLCDTPERNALARQKLGVSVPVQQVTAAA